MSSRGRKLRRPGFTLIEVLVSLVILALLVATVFPVVSKQIEDAAPTRTANDLANLRTGIETFALNVRLFPGDLDDLANALTAASDSAVDGDEFQTKHIQRWKGPYIDAFLPDSARATGDAIVTGFDGHIQNDLGCYDPAVAITATPFTSSSGTASCSAGNFVAVQIADMTGSEFEQLNDLVDGTAEADGDTDSYANGKLRFSPNGGADSLVFYLAVPYAN